MADISPSVDKLSKKWAQGSSVFTSVFFGLFYLVAVILIGIGALFAFSKNAENALLAQRILNINFFIIGILSLYLLYRVWTRLYSARAGDTAPQLHRRFLLLFSLSSLLPALIVGILFGMVVTRDVNELWDDSIATAAVEAENMRDQYLRSVRRLMLPELRLMANDLSRSPELVNYRITMTSFLITQAVFRDMPSVYILNGKGEVLARAESNNAPPFRLPSADAWQRAKSGEVPQELRPSYNYISLLLKLEGYDDTYIYAGRFLEPGFMDSLGNLQTMRSTLDFFADRQDTINRLLTLVYIQIAVMILMAAIWLGLLLAGQIVTPLGTIVLATEKVRTGDLSARVGLKGVWGEIGTLADAFNRMTGQLGEQREELVREHDIAEQRRIFSEAVLSGVSAGVIGVSPKGRITLVNRSAQHLLGRSYNHLIGQPLASSLEPFMDAYARAKENVNGIVEDQVEIETPDGQRNFDLRVSSYNEPGLDSGYVITFDDMTRLVAAQRQSAWREVARRIAHEIKNPLTPIQLSAERLQRKYAGEITSDSKTFNNLTETITRQVGTLERMVNAFSDFAKTPAPEREIIVFQELMETTLFAQRVAFPEIEYVVQDNTNGKVSAVMDIRLLGQAFTNIFKNAAESITSRIDHEGRDKNNGRIDVLIDLEGEQLVTHIIDNGLGWPFEDINRLLEPYVTTRESGTGLGLPIVKRIIEDHGGQIELSHRPDGGQGAYVKVILPSGEDQKLMIENDTRVKARG